jgi:hypothetical protein
VIHDHGTQLLAAGAMLDDLAPDEVVAYEAHRAGCLDCRRLEAELDHVLADLALVVPERVPPADLFGAIQRALAADGPGARSGAVPLAPAVAERPAGRPGAAPSAASRLRTRSRAPLIGSLGLAAALAVVAIGLGSRAASLESDLAATGARVAALEAALVAEQDAVTVAANPARVSVALHGDALAPDAQAAVVFLPGTDDSFLVARNLPATPAGHGYQLWYADGAGVHPLQVVSWDGEGTMIAPIGVDLADSAAVMLTLEPEGGAQGEPGPQVVFGEL